jgi:hypothetical protein
LLYIAASCAIPTSGDGAVYNEDFRQRVDVPIDEQAHVISTDLVVLRRRIDELVPADNLVGATEGRVRVTPAEKDMLFPSFARKESA